MNITKISAIHFRNLKETTMVPTNGMNIIYGNNAQGKTNLLEAMWLFTGGHSFRGTKDSDLILFGEKTAKITMNFYTEERDQEASIEIINGKRSAIINDVSKKSASALVGKFCAVVFSPEHLSLVKEGPGGRRNFIDTSLCQIKPSYAKLLFLYNRTLTQRNTLLKEITKHPELRHTLEIWDEKLVKYGFVIWKERKDYIKELAPVAIEIYRGISKHTEEFSLNYELSFLKNSDVSEEDYMGLFLHKLKESHKSDIFLGYTSVGPHRDELNFYINEVSARIFGSQGQQRSVVLALKLAEAAVMEELTQEKPVIFLDDVMSELDEIRQDYILNQLKGKQVFITCCDPSVIHNLKDGSLFEIKNGIIFK